MQKSRLFQLIATLSHKEQKALRIFLASPFFNKRTQVSALFDYLCAHVQNEGILDKQVIFAAIQPNIPYDDQQVRHWMSWLLKLIERFLVIQTHEADSSRWNLLLCQVYRQKKLDDALTRQLKHTEQQLSTLPYRHATYYQHAYTCELEAYRQLGEKGRMSNLNLQALTDRLDLAYFAQKLQQACMALTHQAVYRADYQLSLLPEIIVHIEAQQLHLHHPAIGLYLAAYRMLNEPGATHFRYFKELLFTLGSHFPPQERGDLYLLGINFCIRQYTQGESAYLPDQLELYQQGLAQALFYQDKYLSRYTYRNVVAVGLTVEAYDWVADFIEEYRPKLAPAHRTPMYSFCRAQLAYSQRQYDEVLQRLQTANYRDLLLNLAAKALLIKVFYELDELDLLFAHLDAMQQFIRRKQELVYHHTHYKHLIQYTRRLCELPPGRSAKREQLRAEITQTKEVAEKGWLLVCLVG